MLLVNFASCYYRLMASSVAFKSLNNSHNLAHWKRGFCLSFLSVTKRFLRQTNLNSDQLRRQTAKSKSLICNANFWFCVLLVGCRDLRQNFYSNGKYKRLGQRFLSGTLNKQTTRNTRDAKDFVHAKNKWIKETRETNNKCLWSHTRAMLQWSVPCGKILNRYDRI